MILKPIFLSEVNCPGVAQEIYADILLHNIVYHYIILYTVVLFILLITASIYLDFSILFDN